MSQQTSELCLLLSSSIPLTLSTLISASFFACLFFFLANAFDVVSDQSIVEAF